MATLYITEFASGAPAGNPVASRPALASQTVAITAGSVQSNAFSDRTTLIRVHTDAICSVAVGENPSALTTSSRMAGDQTEYWSVTPGHKLAVIANT